MTPKQIKQAFEMAEKHLTEATVALNRIQDETIGVHGIWLARATAARALLVTMEKSKFYRAQIGE